MFKRFIVRNNKSIILLVEDNLDILDLKSKISDKLKLKNLDFFLTHNGRLLKDSKKINSYDIDNYDIIDINFRKRGGFALAIMIVAIIAILVILAKPLVQLIIAIGQIIGLLFHFLAIFPPLLEVVISLFNPRLFINDLIFGVSFGIKSLISGMMSSVDAGSSSNKSKSSPGSIPTVCVPPTLMNLMLLVICPPLALFLDRGVQGFFLVVVCAGLTMKLYYFPGLIFAALHILC
jgi:uncharacterized membrane protein YqaE (UPF0057 family)